MKTTFLASLFLCLALSAWAQSPQASVAPPEIPSGPLLHPASNFSRWEVTFSYPDAQQKNHKSPRKTKAASPGIAATRLRKVVTTKTGRIVHEEQTDVLDQTIDNWYDGGTQYTKSAKDSTWYQLDKLTVGTATDVIYHPLPAVGYRGMDLVTQENYAGTTSYNNQRCFVFTPGGYQKLDLNEVKESQKKLRLANEVAYVDADSRSPVAVRSGGEVRIFQFDPPPTAIQVLPADLSDQIKKGQEARARLEKPASRPY